jgi:MoxR-like ATPase
MDGPALKARAGVLLGKVTTLRQEISKQIIGQERLVDDLIVAVLAGGHVLLEGLPGLGKTLLVRSLAKALGLEYSRVQFTPDLMPSDVTGTVLIEERGGERSFRFQNGPIFASLVLADEINRATPKTQSAMLEAMQEGSVTVAGVTHKLPEPFHVIATQNPIELEGTYPLPEAQLDRFMFKLEVNSPPVEAMVKILGATTGTATAPVSAMLQAAEVRELQQLVREVLCGSHLLRYVAELLQATHPDSPNSSESTKRFVRYGASARAGQAIVLGSKARALLAGRAAVSGEDIESCLLPSLRHRVVLGFEADAARANTSSMLGDWKKAAERAAH